MNLRDSDSSVLIDMGRIMAAANLGNILTFLVRSQIFRLMSFLWPGLVGAAGCSYLEGCGIYFCEYVYGTFSSPPTGSTDFQHRISVTMMSRLMLNLRDPKHYTPISGRIKRGTTTTGSEHVVFLSTSLDSHMLSTDVREESSADASSRISTPNFLYFIVIIETVPLVGSVDRLGKLI